LDTTLSALAEERVHLLRPGVADQAGHVVPVLRFELRRHCMIVVAAIVVYGVDRAPPTRGHRAQRTSGEEIAIVIKIRSLWRQVQVVLRGEFRAFRTHIADGSHD